MKHFTPVRPSSKTKTKTRQTTKKSKSRSKSKGVKTKGKEIEALEGEILRNPPTVSIKEESKYLEEYMAMFHKLRKMRRMAEEKYMLSRSSRDIYALVAIYSQQREVIADIRSSTDLSEHAHAIIESILEPMMNSIAQDLLNSFYSMKQILIANVDDDKTEDTVKLLTSIVKNQASFVQKEFDVARQRVLEVFNEPL